MWLPGNEDRVTLHQQVLLRNDMVLLLSVHNVLLLQALEGKGLGLVCSGAHLGEVEMGDN